MTSLSPVATLAVAAGTNVDSIESTNDSAQCAASAEPVCNNKEAACHTLSACSNLVAKSVARGSAAMAGVDEVGVNDGDDSNQGLKLREGMKGAFYNFIVTGFPKRGCQVEHDVTISNMDNGDLTFKNSIIDNVNPFKFTTSDGSDASVTNMFDAAANANQTATDGSLVSFLSGYVGTSSAGAHATSGLGSWFTSVNYIGAVEAGNDWTAAWTKAL